MAQNQAEKKQKQIQMPLGFLYGAASSSHQVEGNNTNNDWWFYEQEGRLPKSKEATDHYHKYIQDFDIAKQIGLNAMRISIEWSRIEPEYGKYNHEELLHYKLVLQAMKAHGLTRMVTLHHFTLPVWAARMGGFKNNKVINAFAKFAHLIAKELGADIDLWSVINEPGVYVYMSYINGKWPPFKHNPVLATRIYLKLIKAHKKAYRAIKSARPDAKVGIAKNNIYYSPHRLHSFLDMAVVKFSNWYGNHYFLNRIKKHLDFIGLNYYFTHTITFSKTKFIEQIKVGGLSSDMGWRTYPKGVYFLVMDLFKRYNKPIYITENGIANARDDMRKDFIYQHLAWLKHAMEHGADVRGYFYWSLTDTYEWQDGYDPKFGLVEVNFETQERKIRPSADVFKELLTHES